MRSLELTDERIARFWERVERRGPDECWPWLGEIHTTGHGVYREPTGRKSGLKFYAHRLSLLIAGVDIDRHVVRHDCDNPPCVNPLHLRTGTQADNIQDAIDRGRMNVSGLAIGQGPTYPPRPCRRCGVIVSAGRKRYCVSCRRVVSAEIAQRSRLKRRLGKAA